MVVDSPNVGVALGLVAAAGGATALGASVVFFPSLVKLASKRVLAGSLGLSAGVMTYVSFVEIFAKSLLSFQDAGHEPGKANLYATLSFFGGVIIMMIVDVLVHFLSGDNHHHGAISLEPGKSEPAPEVVIRTPHCVGCSDDPVRELEEWHQRADKEILEEENKAGGQTVSVDSPVDRLSKDGNDDGNEINSVSSSKDQDCEEGKVEATTAVSIVNLPPQSSLKEDHEDQQLIRMGLSTALAIGIHNFPEGLATFVAALDDPSLGAVLAIAIGIHNIPEGLCVALPIYYATGNRWKAFGWACISGISEPIAALLGWLVLANAVNDEVYAILFGIVSGMMVIISLKELIPTAHRYDPQDTVVTHSVIAGMVIIALSLVLFQL